MATLHEQINKISEEEINKNPMPVQGHFFSSGIYARQMLIPKGHLAQQHSHTYDHMSILASGHVIVTSDENSIEYIAPACIEIKANIKHRVLALKDSVWFCIHATSATDIEEIEIAAIQETLNV